MGDVSMIDEVLLRTVRLGAEFPFQWRLVRSSDTLRSLTAADALAILGDRVPVIAWDDSGPAGALMFPDSDMGCRLAKTLRDQLNDALREDAACPAESFPEPGAPDVDADDFDEPAGGEFVRILREEEAHLAALKSITVTPSKCARVSATQEYSRAAREGSALEAAAKAAAAAPPAAEAVDSDRGAFNGWCSGDRFTVLDRDDAARAAAAAYLWPVWWGGASAGHVITRCDMHLAGHHTVPGLLVDCEGLSRPTVIAAATLSACARKVTA